MDHNSIAVRFAQSLGSNQESVREKALKRMKTYFKNFSVSQPPDEENMLKLWKGIFYYFWNCDKPLFQEDRADVLSAYIHCFQLVEHSLLYLDTFLQTMVREWFTIDRYRLEKFMMLIRKFLYETFVLLKKNDWDNILTQHFKNVLKKTVINSSSESAPLDLKIHIAEIYLDELVKAGGQELTPESVKMFVRPFCNLLCKSEEPSLVKTITKEIFLYLINQDVDEDKFGEFAVLKFDAENIQRMILKYANKPGVRRKNMKAMHDIIKQYEDYKSGLKDKILPDLIPNRRLRKRDIDKAALRLIEEEVKDKKVKVTEKN